MNRDLNGKKGTPLRILKWLAVTSAALVALIPPAGYFISGYNHLAGTLEAEAEVDAFFVSRLISSSPTLWAYQTTRLEDVLERRPLIGAAEQRRIIDPTGKVVAGSGADISSPVISRSHSVFDSGRAVADLVITRSLQPLLIRTWFVTLAGAGLGAVLYYLLSILPIAAARRAEEKLEIMNAELRAGNEDLRFFIFMLSHDLRTPLVSIQGFSGELHSTLSEAESLMKRSVEGTLLPGDRDRSREIFEKEIPASLNFVRSGVERIHELVNAVMKLSRVNQEDLRPAMVNLPLTVASVLDQLKKEVEQRNVKIEIGDLPAVFADRSAMQEIMTNLIDNAIKYLSPDRPGLVRITGRKEGRETVIRVQDNGRGIASEELPRVFGFFRKAGDQCSKGEGMGLAYAKALVKRHRGRIWCESEPGTGTIFSVAFPNERQRNG